MKLKVTMLLDVEYVETHKRVPEAPPSYSHGGLPAEPAEYQITSVRLNGFELFPHLDQHDIDDILEALHEAVP